MFSILYCSSVHYCHACFPPVPRHWKTYFFFTNSAASPFRKSLENRNFKTEITSNFRTVCFGKHAGLLFLPGAGFTLTLSHAVLLLQRGIWSEEQGQLCRMHSTAGRSDSHLVTTCWSTSWWSISKEASEACDIWQMMKIPLWHQNTRLGFQLLMQKWMMWHPLCTCSVFADFTFSGYWQNSCFAHHSFSEFYWCMLLQLHFCHWLLCRNLSGHFSCPQEVKGDTLIGRTKIWEISVECFIHHQPS